ncbi:helix-turn-helix domain-containing protein [Anaerotignum sp.]|uniref:helix-turn-helix domain-containing protein n=1 Tax=Anaerotignum sp. TaxID=2039241 RepID=UPI002896A204|nr:helix-turn-helix transcriptional regulator [Anaerotignum sp.]
MVIAFFFFFFFYAFSERLKLAMKKMDMSPRDLAMLSDVSTVTVQRWLRGDYMPRFANLDKISYVLNVSTDYLHGRED